MSDDGTCVCGEPAMTRVLVNWADGPSVYVYCPECAADVIETIEGTAVVEAP